MNANKKKDLINNNSMSTRGLNKKIVNNIIDSSYTLDSKNNNNTQILSKSNNVYNSTKNNVIFDQEFISYINNLSDIINTFQKSNNINILKIKNILENSNNDIKNH